CAEDLLRGVKKMKGSEIQKIFTPNNPSGFYIEVVVKDIELLPDLQLAIIQGLNNIDFVKRQITIKKENIKQMIEQVQVEMKRLDSTKTKVEGILDKNESRSSSLMLDVSGLNGQLINMNEKLLGYKSELQFLAPVQVLDGFSKNNNPTGPSLFVWLGLGLFTCLALAYLFALFSSVNAKLKARKTGMQNG
ncbi:MAG TPA: hypothetical protein VLJ68_02645, partial [Chitinophagaceae bacterium]|nr:hypothetical protein [Chitinophagaceae bacterium]